MEDTEEINREVGEQQGSGMDQLGAEKPRKTVLKELNY